jgi:hypothetical protein
MNLVGELSLIGLVFGLIGAALEVINPTHEATIKLLWYLVFIKAKEESLFVHKPIISETCSHFNHR